MRQVPSTLDPLAGYLEHRCRVILAHANEWTPELRIAARDYFVQEMGADDYAVLVDELVDAVPDGPRPDQAEFIVEHHNLWDVIQASHRAAIRTMPSLEELISRLQELTHSMALAKSDPDYQPYINAAYGDIGYWLYAHATVEQRVALLHHFELNEPAFPPDSDWWYFEYGYWLRGHAQSLKAIAQAWEAIAKPVTPAKQTALPTDAIRTWAKERGYQVGSRGRIPHALVRKYQKEQQND